MAFRSWFWGFRNSGSYELSLVVGRGGVWDRAIVVFVYVCIAGIGLR